MTKDLAHAEHLARPAFMVIVEGQCDAIWDTKAQAMREQRDLIKMDCGKVTIKGFKTWADAHAYEDKLAGL